MNKISSTHLEMLLLMLFCLSMTLTVVGFPCVVVKCRWKKHSETIVLKLTKRISSRDTQISGLCWYFLFFWILDRAPQISFTSALSLHTQFARNFLGLTSISSFVCFTSLEKRDFQFLSNFCSGRQNSFKNSNCTFAILAAPSWCFSVETTGCLSTCSRHRFFKQKTFFPCDETCSNNYNKNSAVNGVLKLEKN